MINTRYIAVFFFAISSLVNAQSQKSFALSSELKEISGLEILNDSTLAAINDGGNEPLIYLLSNKGETVRKVKVRNVENNDWEDITRDEEYLYIGDIGNNRNTRRDLKIYKVRIEDVLLKEEVSAETIAFNYVEQTAFPPGAENKLFDAEALTFHNDSLWIITKPNPKPWVGDAGVYVLPTRPGTYSLKQYSKLFVGPDSWLSDAVTGADFFNDELYITTYNRVIRLKYEEKGFFQVNVWGYENPSQMESIVVKRDGELILADEKNAMLGGGKLYYLRVDVSQH